MSSVNASADLMIGNAAHNLLYGQEGDADTLIGGGGIDKLFGGRGNDAYYLDDTTLSQWRAAVRRG